MLSTITFKNISSSQSISDYATKKLDKIKHFKDYKIITAKFIFSSEKENSFFISELNLDVKNKRISATAKSKNLYKAIDESISKAYKQLQKKKTYFKQKRYLIRKAS